MSTGDEKNLERELNNMKTQRDIVLIAALCVLAIACVFAWGWNFQSDSAETMGQMICDEKGHGDFVTLDKDEKTVKCEPKKRKEKFNDGYVEVTEQDDMSKG